MKHVILVLIAFSSLCSCSFIPISRHKSIKNEGFLSPIHTYSYRGIDVHNAETILLDDIVVSNSFVYSMDIALNTRGYNRSEKGDIEIQVKITIEENDIINNRQSLSLYLDFFQNNSRVATFVLSSKSKEFILNKDILIGEFYSILNQIDHSLKENIRKSKNKNK